MSCMTLNLKTKKSFGLQILCLSKDINSTNQGIKYNYLKLMTAQKHCYTA